MATLLGARRPAFKRKVLLIVIAAIFLVIAWAKAGFPCISCPSFEFGPDGVMPPNYSLKAPNRTIVQIDDNHKSYTYTLSSRGNGIYVITRDGKPWLITTYNKSTGRYEISDSNGTGLPVLKFVGPKSAQPILNGASPK
ncbi:MAG TPA: hypothetical protein VFF00_08445 [Candidatus Elarobacter sp.]|nr:hypothetical protein [Candidatus Elarobacter sp.]